MREGVAPGKTDRRWDTDSAKRARCDLENLQFLKLSPAILARRFSAIASVPLLSERRGFDGLDGPKGEYLGVTGMHAYSEATLDKTLTEAALLDVGPALWNCHARFAAGLAEQWARTSSNKWSFLTLYVDGTAEPYWTGRFAQSGKISRCNRVGPSIARVALMGGPGVPLIFQSSAGSLPLKKTLIGLIEFANQALGPCLLKRAVIVDAEAASARFLHEMMGMKEQIFVTVLKGPAFRSTRIEDAGEWMKHGERDRIRPGKVTLHGKGAPQEGVTLTVVQRERIGGRNPHTTLFATNASLDEVSPAEVVAMYLSRWPNQEQKFRNTRNGLGFEHTHGYGGEYVAHVAIGTALEKAESRERKTKENLDACRMATARIAADLKISRANKLKQANEALLKFAEKEQKSAETAVTVAAQEVQRLKTMPQEIYSRDTNRENIVTALTATMMVLIEYVLRNYFGDSKMEYRTFIEHFIHTPTTVRTTRFRTLYQLDANPRNQGRTEELRRACQAVTGLRLRSEGRLLVFEVVERSGKRP